MKNILLFERKTLTPLLMVVFFCLFSLNLTAQSITPNHWEFDDLDDFEPMVTTITWGSATDVIDVYIVLGDENEEMPYVITDDNGTTATLTIYPPSKSVNANKNNPLTMIGYVVFDVGDPEPFSVTILDFDHWDVYIWTYDEDNMDDIPFAEIYFHEIDEIHYTDDWGEIYIELDEGIHTLDISAAGYHDIINYQIDVFYDFGGTDFEIPMQKDESFLHVLSSNPYDYEYGVDVYSNIYIEFDNHIQEGIVGLGFGEITFYDQYDNPWGVENIFINDNYLQIYLDHPLDMSTSYTLHIPNTAVAHADNIGVTLEEDFVLTFTTDDGTYYHPWIEQYKQYFSFGEPEDIIFDIHWGSETYIDHLIWYWWDEFDNYQETPLTEGVEFDVVGDELIFYETFILSANPDMDTDQRLEFRVEFSEFAHDYIEIRYVPSFLPSIAPDEITYDLSNPDFVVTNIVYATAAEVVEVRDSEGPISDYQINGSWLIIEDAYLAANLLMVNDEVTLTVEFNTGDEVDVTITAIQTGVNGAVLDPVFVEVSGNDPVEFVDILITWNDASSVTEMYVHIAEDWDVWSFEFTNYEVIPIDANTATLRITIGEGEDPDKVMKAIEENFVTIEVNFDIGSPKHILLKMTWEYYEVIVEQFPWHGGWVEGGWMNYGVGEEVVLTAHPDENYEFVKWVLDDNTEITDNPYIFTMPNHDVYIEAHFLSNFLEVIYSNPYYEESNVDPTQNIYITFNRDIQEGQEYNGFDDIIFETGYGHHLDRNIYIVDGSSMVIEPIEPLNEFYTYQVIIPDHAVADADDINNTMQWEFFLRYHTGAEEYFEPSINPTEQIFSLMEPEDVDFMIDWGSETYINQVYHFYWEEDDMEFIYLDEGVDFFVDGDVLTISSDFILGLNPEVYNDLGFNVNFGSGYDIAVYIITIPTLKPSINPSTADYDLSNPGDVSTSIVFMSAEELVSVSNGTNTLVPGTDYTLNGSWLFIKESYLSNELTAVDDEIELTLQFDTEDEVEFTITAIESGITNATINPTEFTVYNDDAPEYIDITITWNDATAVEDLYIIVVDGGYTEEFPYEDYEVTPIDSETANLRVDFGNDKNLEYIYVTIIINFDIGSPAHFYLTIVDEYYDVFANVIPDGAGWVDGAWDYDPGDNVVLTAHPFGDYIFHSWRIDGVVVSTDNPYSFEMPNEDVYITAHFTTDDVVTYTLDLLVEPEGAGIVSGGGEFAFNESVTISATANEGFAFVNWTTPDETIVSADNPYTFDMPDDDLTLIANFIDVSSVELENIQNFSVYPNPFSDNLIIKGLDSRSRVIFTQVTGQIIREFKADGDVELNTSDLPSGFYLLIIESHDGTRHINKLIKQ